MSKSESVETSTQEVEGMKLCECGRCNELIPAINKLSKPAKYKHGHNLRTPEITKKARKASPGHTRHKHTGDMSRFGRHRIGIPPTNAFKKGEHFGRTTEFKKGHVPSESNRRNVSMVSKRLWATDKEYRKKCLLAPRKRKKSTSIELKLKTLLEELKIDFEMQFYIRYKEKRFKCFADFYIKNRNLVIFCDQEYWHSRQEVVKRDKVQNEILTLLKYQILRLSDKEINEMTLDNLKFLLLRYSPILQVIGD